MKKAMVISSLTIYAIAFTCVSFWVGTSLATGQEVELGKADKRSGKAQNRFFSNRAKTNGDIRALNESHSYFALFDPVANKTRKFEVKDSGGLPWRVNADFGLFQLNATEVKDEPKVKIRRKNTSKHPWDNGRNGMVQNFIARDTLQDSETETRVHYNGITAKETMVKTGVDEETGKR